MLALITSGNIRSHAQDWLRARPKPAAEAPQPSAGLPQAACGRPLDTCPARGINVSGMASTSDPRLPTTPPPTTRARPPRAPEIEELRTLCAAAELGSLGRAAVRLHASQPALSKRLAHLETLAGTRLLERSPQGVKLTPAGRRLYEEARRLLQQSERVAEVMQGLAREGGPVRLAASHSATDALVADLLGHLNARDSLAVELVCANSTVVRDLVADGRADLGIAASRPNRTPYPGVREELLAPDEVICAVPPGHPWARRESVTLDEFLATPMVVRDPASNARWTVDTLLRERELEPAAPLMQAGTPSAARREALARRAPVLLSRSVLAGHGFHEVPVDGLSFRRQYVFVMPAIGEPAGEVRALMDELRHQAVVWLRDRPLPPPPSRPVMASVPEAHDVEGAAAGARATGGRSVG